MPAAVLLDLDGVLVDSRAAIVGALRHALARHGLPPRCDAELQGLIGPPLTAGVAALLRAAPDSSLVTDVVRTYRERYATTSRTETTVVPGIPEALDALVAAGATLAVATSKPRRFAEPLLDALRLRRHFELVGAPEGDGPEAAKAAVVAGALQTLGADAGVLVGDRRFDVEGAHANGLTAVGATWGIGSREELARAGADELCEDPADLPATALALAGVLRPRW